MSYGDFDLKKIKSEFHLKIYDCTNRRQRCFTDEPFGGTLASRCLMFVSKLPKSLNPPLPVLLYPAIRSNGEYCWSLDCPVNTGR
jgi:hypothetical protein